MTAAAARELEGREYNREVASGGPRLSEALLEGRHVLLQACMYLEHRARLSILRAATDYLAEGGFVRDMPQGVRVDFRASDLPQSFLRGFARAEQQPNFRLYPLFWQVFLWGWGGLILLDREHEDYVGLAEQTGLAVSEIPSALEAFDWFFPTDGWLSQMPTASYRYARMVPWPFQGLGAWQRLLRAQRAEYDELGLGGQYTVTDLGSRHNSFVRTSMEILTSDAYAAKRSLGRKPCWNERAESGLVGRRNLFARRGAIHPSRLVQRGRGIRECERRKRRDALRQIAARRE